MYKFLITSLVTFAIHALPASASSHRNARGAYVNVYAGPFVYKSDTINGTDFSNIVGMDFGANYGKDKEYGLVLHTDKMSTVFRQTESEVDTEFTEFRLNYRNLWFLPTFIVGHGTLLAKSSDPAIGEIADMAFIYSGAGLDLEMPYSNMITVHVRLRSVTFTTVSERTGKEASFAPRNEFDAGIRFELPVPVIYVNGGYLHRSWSIDIDNSGAKAQVQTGPYVGLTFGHDF